MIQEHTKKSLEEFGWKEIFGGHPQNQNLKKEEDDDLEHILIQEHRNKSLVELVRRKTLQ